MLTPLTVSGEREMPELLTVLSPSIVSELPTHVDSVDSVQHE